MAFRKTNAIYIVSEQRVLSLDCEVGRIGRLRLPLSLCLGVFVLQIPIC